MLSGPGLVRAQQPAPFRVTTRLVQVSVIVSDRNRNPVGGLTASDFRLYDDGKEQRVELFSMESDRVPPTRGRWCGRCHAIEP
jgi:hypothetical protein